MIAQSNLKPVCYIDLQLLEKILLNVQTSVSLYPTILQYSFSICQQNFLIMVGVCAKKTFRR